jgi:hypothetical protein
LPNLVPTPAPAPAHPPLTAPTTVQGAGPDGVNLNPYLAMINAIQASQDRDAKAIREMIENRQANMSIIKAMQTADANTAHTFEKLLNQLKSNPAASVPVSTPQEPKAAPPSPTARNAQEADIKTIVRDLADLSKSIRRLSAQMPAESKDK